MQSERILLRLGDAGLRRECWRRGREEESLILVQAFLIPDNLNSGVRDLGGNYGRGSGVEGNSGAEEGGDDHVMV